jgi:hypothetical protein
VWNRQDPLAHAGATELGADRGNCPSFAPVTPSWLDSILLASHECADPRVNTMQLETKFLRLRTPVELGSRFGDWRVTWLGGWSRYRLYYLVMVVKLQPPRPSWTTAHPDSIRLSFPVSSAASRAVRVTKNS